MSTFFEATLTLFAQIVSTDDYMPMPIKDIDEYDKIIDVGWYIPDEDREEKTFVLDSLLRSCILTYQDFHASYLSLRCIQCAALTLEIFSIKSTLRRTSICRDPASLMRRSDKLEYSVRPHSPRAYLT